MNSKPIKLQEFVRETLLEIINGVADAQSEELPNNAEVGPVFEHILQTKDGTISGINEKRSPIFEVDFDVSVTTSLSTETKGKMGVAVHVISLGTQGATKKENAAVSRIRFRVPLVLPGKLYQDVMPEATYGAEDIIDDM